MQRSVYAIALCCRPLLDCLFACLLDQVRPRWPQLHDAVFDGDETVNVVDLIRIARKFLRFKANHGNDVFRIRNAPWHELLALIWRGA